ncbi:MAG: cobalamin biosynthesis protein CobD [Chloroflexi bacterium]|nr:cobalamin biosynthesis protein CobD [Chloroflexota bacterium]
MRVPRALLLALLLDACLGEPPPRLHPVVWMGGALSWLEARAPRRPMARLVYGGLAAVALPACWGLLGACADRVAPWPVQALLLKPTFAGRSLLLAGRRVEDALVDGDVDRARTSLRWLVSRPTANLGAGLVAAAAIESLAENLVDSWLAPLLAYACFGLAGCYVYRAANTADAMWGYRTPAYVHLGKAAARLDDALNLLPARIGALLLIGLGRRRRESIAVWRRDAARTPSPNAGQSMAAIAGQLGVRLEKPDTYVLNAVRCEPTAADLQRARKLVMSAMLVSAALSLVLRGVQARA